MLTHSRLFMAALTAALVLAFGTSVASASRSLELRGGERGVTASSVLTLNGTELREELDVVCPITLLRTLSRIIPKVEILMGALTGVAINLTACRGTSQVVPLTAEGTAAPCRRLTADIELCTVNWKLMFVSISGTLPDITDVLFYIRDARFRIRNIASCLFAGDAFGNVNVERRTVTSASANLALTRLRRISEFFCPISTATFDGTFRVSPTLTIALL